MRSKSPRKRRTTHVWGVGTLPEYQARQAATDAPDVSDGDPGTVTEKDLRASPEYRLLVAEIMRRAGGRCEIRFDRCTGTATTPHHRWPTQGRCGGPVIVPAWWLVAACRQCHQDVHGSQRERAERLGWIIPKSRSLG